MMSVQSWRSSFPLLLLLVLHTHGAKLPNILGKNATTTMADVESHSFRVIEVVKSIEQKHTNFTGVFNSEYSVDSEGDIKLSSVDEQRCLSWEIAWPRTGKRVDQFIRFRDLQPPHSSTLTEPKHFTKTIKLKKFKPRRGKRHVYGADNRHYIPISIFGRRFPFASVVKLSTGCTGTLVSPKHVLTAAHCIHNQTDYVTGFKNLSVGLLPSTKFGRKFKWIGVNQSFLPNGWLMGNADIASRFDYSLLELEETHDKPYFELGVSEGKSRARIHFTAFEDDKPSSTIWYRNCRILDTDDHVLYHKCDAKPGSSGAGVYAWADTDGGWKRRLIGVFSGNRWKYYDEWWKQAVNFNAAIRFSTSKYTQICGWMGSHAVKSCK